MCIPQKFAKFCQVCIITSCPIKAAGNNKNKITTHLGLTVMTASHSDLLHLKNLGTASVNILHAVGVNTYEDLKAVGPVATYCRIKQRGIAVSKVMLYALQGALLNIHWSDLPPEIKQQLIDDVERTSATENGQIRAH